MSTEYREIAKKSNVLISKHMSTPSTLGLTRIIMKSRVWKNRITA
ncbi:MAG: hypothetical protein NWE87_03520 [Candidatus Bathyarchaeota archaeon]|jgi:hypothetical protein|nr:hypothetical protein [Candidatus Bathyarchaeota archaeon]